MTLAACSKKEYNVKVPQKVVIQETVSKNTIEESIEMNDTAEIHVPSKDAILVMRELVLEGMADDEIERLVENVKIANLRLESAY